MALYLRCIFYPNSKLFIVSGGKEQSARIAEEKIQELWKFFPALKNEIIDQRGAKNTSSFQRDYIKLVFKNGSYLDIVAARQFSYRWLSINLSNYWKLVPLSWRQSVAKLVFARESSTTSPMDVHLSKWKRKGALTRARYSLIS